MLASAFLTFASSFLEQTFKGSAFYIHVHRRPIFLVDHRNHALEVDWIVKARSSLREDVAQQSASFAKLAQNVSVMIGQCCTRFSFHARPVAVLGNVRATLISHLEEEQIGQLFDVIAVINAVVTQRVAKAPELVDDVGHTSGTPRLIGFSRCEFSLEPRVTAPDSPSASYYLHRGVPSALQQFVSSSATVSTRLIAKTLHRVALALISPA